MEFHNQRKISGLKERYSQRKHPLSSIINITFLLGVDIRSNKKHGSKGFFTATNIYLKTLAFLWISSFCIEIALFFTTDVYFEKSVKAGLARKLNVCNSFITWSVLKLKAKDISGLITVVCNLGRSFNVTVSRLLVKICVLTIFVAIAFHYVSLVILMDKNGCKSRVQYFTFSLLHIPDDYYCTATHPINVLMAVPQSALPNAVTALYVVLCLWMSKMLKRQAADFLNVIHSGRESTLKHHCKRYDLLLRALQNLEKSMRFLMFINQISDFMGVFGGFMRLTQVVQPERFKKYQATFMFVSVRSIVSYLCVSVSAAKVNEAGAEVKSAIEVVLKHLVMETKHRERSDYLLPIFVFSKSPPFVLTGWGFFRFTRGYILSAVGSVLTYALLISQLDFF